MSKTIEDNITDYITYFRSQLQLIEDHCPNSRDGDLHKRILFSAILDAISRTVFIKEKNRDRIVKFVNVFCDWSECNRVSLSHLYRLVSNKSEQDLIPLRNFAIGSMTQWKRAEKILLKRDPVINEVEKYWPQVDSKPRTIDSVSLKLLQHSQLLYTYRNSLIHEFRTPGRHVELWDIDEPYYASLTEYRNDDSNDFERTWELQYTANFFKRLCASGLSNLERHLTEKRINPYKSINWGNSWIRELNL
jgi:hypothetical protein